MTSAILIPSNLSSPLFRSLLALSPCSNGQPRQPKHREEDDPYGIDLNKILAEGPNSKALVLVNDARSLTIIPPPKAHSCGQSYFARPILPSPPQPLFLKGAPPKGPIVKLSKGTKVLPPKPNETLLGVNKNRSGEIVCAKYTTRERP
jgi:hypothetical protein